MTETAKETLDRLARTIRTESADLEKMHRTKNNGERRASRPADADYQVGRIDGLNQAADLLDEGKGK